MPTGIEELVAAFEVGVVAAQATLQVVNSTTDAPAYLSVLQKTFVKLVKSREVLGEDGETELPIVQSSPIAKALKDLYYHPRSHGRSYVLYAPASSGKSTAAKNFLKAFCPTRNSRPPNGLMISGLAPNDDYFAHMASKLGATGTARWFSALVQALQPDARNDGLPSILILDEFNSAGKDEINIALARMIYKSAVDKRFYVVFITQNKDVANELCNLNNRQKIGPLPLACTNFDASPDESVAWADMSWGRNLLTKFLREKYGTKFPQLFDGVAPEDPLPWITDDMTPHSALWAVQERTNKLPDPPQDEGRDFVRPPQKKQRS
jgi:hypothetical protein